MATLEVLNHGFQNFLDQGDPRVKDWPMMQSPFPGIAMIGAYVYFVKVAGPAFMLKRKAFELRRLMVVYNFALVLINLGLFVGLLNYSYLQGYSLKCQPVDYSNNHSAVRLAQTGYLFYLVKFLEFIDTIIFVLRKKDNQITALHVIHHSLVPFSLWFGIKFAPGGYNTFFPLLNSFVHVIMYAYYGLAAMGEKYKKYLGWKKYMTYLQLMQFVGVIVYAIFLYANKCDVSKAFIMANFFHALLFFVLFMNFFIQSYIRKKASSRLSSSRSENLHQNNNGPLDLKSEVFDLIESRQNGDVEPCPLKNGMDNGAIEHRPKKNGIQNGDVKFRPLKLGIPNGSVAHSMEKAEIQNGTVEHRLKDH